MSDLIDRQDAIDAIDGLPNCCNGFSDSYDKAYIIGVLEELPSAQSESKNGKWIRESLVTDYPYKCSACKKYSRAMYDYCPWCGACMRG